MLAYVWISRFVVYSDLCCTKCLAYILGGTFRPTYIRRSDVPVSVGSGRYIPPLIYLICNSFTKSKSYINLSFSFLFPFYFLPPREAFTLTKSSSISTQPPTPKHQGYHLHHNLNPWLLDLGRILLRLGDIVDFDLFERVKLQLTIPSEYFYSPRLDQFLVYMYLHI